MLPALTDGNGMLELTFTQSPFTCSTDATNGQKKSKDTSADQSPVPDMVLIDWLEKLP